MQKWKEGQIKKLECQITEDRHRLYGAEADVQKNIEVDTEVITDAVKASTLRPNLQAFANEMLHMKKEIFRCST